MTAQPYGLAAQSRASDDLAHAYRDLLARDQAMIELSLELPSRCWTAFGSKDRARGQVAPLVPVPPQQPVAESGLPPLATYAADANAGDCLPCPLPFSYFDLKKSKTIAL